MNRRVSNPRKLLCIAAGLVLLGETLTVPAAAASWNLPDNATHVGVTSGGTTSGVDGHLRPGATISGTVTSALSGKPVFTEVAVYLRGRLIRSVDTGAGGFTVGGLAPSTTGYAVCAHAMDVRSDTFAPRGYLGRCYKSAAWNYKTVPASTTLIPLTGGQQRTGVNIALRQQSAAITGYVALPNGAAASVVVTARNRTTGVGYPNGNVLTGFTGRFVLRDLPAAPDGYTVCARPQNWERYAPRCSSPVSVKLGTTHSGLRITVPRTGTITGTIRTAGGAAVTGIIVGVYNARGREVASGYSSNGSYRVPALSPSSSYRVCAHPANPSERVHYSGACWSGVTWHGGALPRGVTPVSVHAGQTRGNINFKLTRTVYTLGTIAGTITDQATGQPLIATVDVFRDGHHVRLHATTNSAGQYRVALRPSTTGYVVCATSGGSPEPVSPPATGWAPRCYKTASWYGWERIGEGEQPTGPPSNAVKLPLAARQARSGIDFALIAAGEITGTVTEFGTSTPAHQLEVMLFTAKGTWIAQTGLSAEGGYSFSGLAPQPASATSGYIVCFDGAGYYTAGYLNQCYDRIAW
jgi:hypothetical protein